jgi:dienelactone hydrolase
MMPTDPLVADPPADPRWPAATPAVAIDSSGVPLPGVLHLPAGPGPHPVVVLLHGFPGHERNFDLAQALRRAGFAALVFHYRGSWGAGGSWSWAHVLEDAAAAVTAVRGPALAQAHRLDPRRLAIAGHSLGGFAALRTAAADPSIAAVISVAGFDFTAAAAACSASPASRAAYAEAFGSDLLPLRGTSGEALVAEMERAGQGWSLTALAARLAPRPVLLIGTSRDSVTPAAVHHQAVVDAYLAQAAIKLEHHVFATDHALSDHRVALARTVLAFLSGHRQSPQ